MSGYLCKDQSHLAEFNKKKLAVKLEFHEEEISKHA